MQAASLSVALTAGGGLTISGSGAVTDANSTISAYEGSGTVTMTGGTWTNTGSLVVGGEGGVATLTISGGNVTDANASIGPQQGSGTVTVSGGTWTNTGSLFVGSAGGLASLTISGSGSVIDANSSIGGTAMVSGGTWTNSGTLIVGYSLGSYEANGALTISGSGEVTIGAGSGTLILGLAQSTSGALTIGNGTAFAGTLQAAAITSGSGSASVIFDESNSYTFTPNLTGTMNVTQSGPGTTALTGSTAYVGNTTISAGTLLVSGNGISTSGTVSVAGGAALGMEGSITSGTTFSSLTVGTLALVTGSSAGTSAALLFDLGDEGLSDSLTATTLQLSGSGTVLLNIYDVSGVGTYSLLTWSNTSVGTLGDFVAVPGFIGTGTLELNTIAGNSVLQYDVTSVVPEPALWMLLATGGGVLLGVGYLRRKRKVTA